MKLLKNKWVIPVAALVLTLSIGGAAFATTGSSSTETTAPGTSSTNATGERGFRGGDGSRSDETALTGDTLAKVQAAALAAAGSGSTLIRAETDADGNAKYEAHVKKADGTCVTVYLDESYKVVKTETMEARGGMRGGRLGGGDGSRSDETALTGDTLAKVQAAALAAAGSGSTLIRAETDADGNAKYEAHVKKADGTCVTVYLDESYKVVKTETMQERAQDGDSRGPRGGMRGGMRGGSCTGDCTDGTATTGTISTGGAVTIN